jgi:hypothetical protein
LILLLDPADKGREFTFLCKVRKYGDWTKRYSEISAKIRRQITRNIMKSIASTPGLIRYGKEARAGLLRSKGELKQGAQLGKLCEHLAAKGEGIQGPALILPHYDIRRNCLMAFGLIQNQKKRIKRQQHRPIPVHGEVLRVATRLPHERRTLDRKPN